MKLYARRFFLLLVAFAILFNFQIVTVDAAEVSSQLTEVDAKLTEVRETKQAYIYQENSIALSELHGKLIADTVEIKKVEDGYEVDVTFLKGQYLQGFALEGDAKVVEKQIDGDSTTKVFTLSVDDLSDIYNATITFADGTSQSVQMQFDGKQNPFSDIQGLDNYSKIVSLYSKGIFKESEQFNPDSTTTRYQFALMLYRALDLDVDTSKAASFKDVEGLDSETIAAIKALNAYGIIKGVSEDKFAPHERITRDQAARMIYRLMEKLGYEADPNAEMPFVDVPKADKELVTALAQLNKLGIMTGYQGKLNPSSPLTRDQMAKVLFHSLEVEEVKVVVASQETDKKETDKQDADKQDTDKPSTDTQDTSAQSIGSQSTYTPSIHTPSTYVPSTVTPSTNTPSTDTQSTGTGSTGTPSTDTQSTGTGSTGTPSTDTQSTDTGSTNIPTPDQQPTVTDSTYKNKKFAILVVAGQSNAVGYDESPESTHQLYQMNDRIKQLGIYDDQNMQIIPLTQYAQNFQDMRKATKDGKGTKGLHLPLANLVLPHIPKDYELIVISAAYGGTGFTTDKSYGKYDEENKKPAVDGIYKWGVESSYYRAMVDRIEYILELNPANKYIGTVWIQGEQDGGNPKLHKEQFVEMTNHFFNHFQQNYAGRVWNGEEWGENQWFNVFTTPYWYKKAGIPTIWKQSYEAWNDKTYVDFSFEPKPEIYTNETRGTGDTSDWRGSHYGNDAYATLVAPKVHQKMLDAGAIEPVTP